MLSILFLPTELPRIFFSGIFFTANKIRPVFAFTLTNQLADCSPWMEKSRMFTCRCASCSPLQISGNGLRGTSAEFETFYCGVPLYHGTYAYFHSDLWYYQRSRPPIECRLWDRLTSRPILSASRFSVNTGTWLGGQVCAGTVSCDRLCRGACCQFFF